MNKRIIKRVFAVCYAILIVFPLHADDELPAQQVVQDPSSNNTESTEPVPPLKKTQSAESAGSADKSIFDVSHRVISENIIGLSRNVDSFFSNDRFLEESFGSYGCVRFNTVFSEGGEIETSADVCLKIDLPHTKKRWKLIFESEEVENVNDVLESNAPSLTGVDDQENKSSTALLRYVADQELLKYVSFDIGVKTRTPLDPFSRLRFRRTWVTDPWLFRLTESLYYFKSTEGGFLSRFDMERKFTHKWYARITTQADYRDTEKQFNLSQNFGFYRRVGKGKALSWELSLTGSSQPNPHVDYYVYRFRYRINIWRDWFFFEVSPHLLYQRETDFESEARLLFSAEAVFGNY